MHHALWHKLICVILCLANDVADVESGLVRTTVPSASEWIPQRRLELL